MKQDRGRINDIEKEVSSIKAMMGVQKPTVSVELVRQTETISASQAQAINKLVKEVASSSGIKSRNQTMRIWHEVKKHFGIRRYQELPKRQFEEAMRWLNKRINPAGNTG